MAAQSAVPPNSTGDNPQNTAAQAVPMETSMFVNSEPIREEQVQNAIKFLSHPKVKGSPVMYRRSFLERKGLTKEEIDEAFRRVPDESPSLSTTQATVSNQGGQSQPSSNIQPQVPTQSLQPMAAAPVDPSSKLGTLTASRFHWSHALLAVGILAISGAGTAVVFKKSIVPRLKAWIRKVVLEDEEQDLVNKTNVKPTLAEEAAAAAKAAAAAAADVARASQEMLISKTEEKRYFGELMSLLDAQVQEMKSMSNSIRKLEGQSNNSGREGSQSQVASSRQSNANGKADYASHSVRSLSPPPASSEPSTAPPHPKSDVEIMAMVQRGERRPNIREINDLPPTPNEAVTNPRSAPMPKPWETAQLQVGSTHPQENNFNVQHNGSGLGYWAGFPDGPSERPVQRSSWVPPQPPPVAMAEAAAAIRQPKKLPVQIKEQQSSTEASDELQRITELSESGGLPDSGGQSTTPTNTSKDGLYDEA